VARAVAEHGERRLVRKALPGITDWKETQPELVDRATQWSEQLGGVSRAYRVPALAATGSARPSWSRRSQTVESRASFGAKVYRFCSPRS